MGGTAQRRNGLIGASGFIKIKYFQLLTSITLVVQSPLDRLPLSRSHPIIDLLWFWFLRQASGVGRLWS
jgi:hypothetical protein